MAETKAKGLADLARKYDDANDSLTGIVVESDFTPQSDNTYDLGSSSATFKDLYISGDIKGPATFNIDPSAHGDNTGTLVVKGNLQVDGTTTTINSTTVEVDDKLIFLGTGSVNAAAADGAGVEIDVGTNDPVVSNPSITYNATSDLWNFNKPISISGTQFINSSGVVLDSALDVGGSLSGSLSDVVVQYGVAYSGTPIQGSFFFDSLNQKLKVYTGSTFVDAVPAGTGSSGGTETDANTTFRKYVYTIASVTNAVTGADDNTNTLSYVTDGTENVEVFRNGIKMVQGDANADYAATTGTSVTFTYNLVVGDIVEVQVYELLTNDAYYVKSEVYTKAETNSQIVSAFDGAVTINESGADADFRVEGSGQANALFVQGSDGFVGIGTNTPDQSLVVKTANGGGIAYENSTGKQWRWAVGSTGEFSATESGVAERMHIDTSGNLNLTGGGTLSFYNNGSVVASLGPNGLQLPTFSSDPSSPAIGQMYYNTAKDGVFVWNGTVWVETTNIIFDGSSEAKAAPSATYLADLGLSTGQYWVKPEGASQAYYCDVAIGVSPNGRSSNWVKVAGMSSAGYSGDAGLANMPSTALNTSYLSNNSHFNSEGYNYKVDDDFLNTFGATRMIVQSTAETMTAEFNGSGSHVPIPNLRQYYFDVNNQQSFAGTVDAWLIENVKIYSGSSGPDIAGVWNYPEGITNNHYGWSTQPSGSSRHMLHGAQPGTTYEGFCLGVTCWNQSAAVWLSVDE